MARRGWKVVLAIPALIAAAGLSLAQDAGLEKPAEKPGTILVIAKADPSLKTFVELLGEAELADTLKSAGPYTLFAPSETAFARLGKEGLAALRADKTRLRSVLLNHIVRDAHSADDVSKKSRLKTEQGDVIITARDKNVMFGGAKVTQPDIKASNGVIHVIDAIEMPAKKRPG